MVERYRRGKGKRQLLGSHQKCWVWGKNAVTETLRAGRWTMHELRLSDTLPGDVLQEARETAAKLDVAVIVESPEELTKRCRSGEHQGFLAKMATFPYASAEDIVADAPRSPLYLVLDGIQDPYNFGAMLRSADVMAIDGVFIRAAGQVGVTSLVARASAGAVNHVRIARVDDLPALVRQLRDSGVRIVAATQEAAVACAANDWTQPSALIIGNEGIGVSDELIELADARVSIPQFGHVESLNAAVAAGILLYEARRQRLG